MLQGSGSAWDGSTATSAPLQVVFALEHKRDCIKRNDYTKREDEKKEGASGVLEIIFREMDTKNVKRV